ncbi:MAG: phosphoenolpyruvate--protein phosphotransferase [candidate division WOR-3 bacterium]|jgi:phosphotransferase system enzyme I (PtsI)
MKILNGISANSGLAKGVTAVYTEEVEENIPHYMIEEEKIEKEIARLKEAYGKTKEAIENMLKASEEIFGKTGEDIFAAHGKILEDEALFEEIISLIKKRLINAEHAVNDVFESYQEKFKQKDSHFSEMSHDLVDIRNRILSSFDGVSGQFECPEGERQPVVVVSKRLTPSMVLNIAQNEVLAFVTEEGGLTSHATILAQNYGVPIVFGVEAVENVGCGDKVIVDASLGKVFVDPDKKTEKYYDEKIKEAKERKKICVIRKEEPAQTKRGVRLTLKANISLQAEIKLLEGLNYDGVGLLRSEFLFMNRNKAPTEEEWFRVYKNIAQAAKDKSVDIRLLDIGGDKMPAYLRLPSGENDDLGIRGARAINIFHDMYLSQTKAILRAASYGNLRLLYPMISDLSDIESFREIVKKAKSTLDKERKRYNEDIKEGIMIETPAAAVMTGTLLRHADFANIGSNDLLEYTLAASRNSQIIEKRYHILHPSLVRLMEIIVREAQTIKKEICLCGEVASFEEFYPLFLSIGLDSFSVEASKLSDIKCNLLHIEKPDTSYPDKFYQNFKKDDIEKFFRK